MTIKTHRKPPKTDKWSAFRARIRAVTAVVFAPKSSTQGITNFWRRSATHQKYGRPVALGVQNEIRVLTEESLYPAIPGVQATRSDLRPHQGLGLNHELHGEVDLWVFLGSVPSRLTAAQYWVQVGSH